LNAGCGICAVVAIGETGLAETAVGGVG